MYKSLTDEEKSAWEYRAEQDKFRYEEEMKTYNPVSNISQSPMQRSANVYEHYTT